MLELELEPVIKDVIVEVVVVVVVAVVVVDTGVGGGTNVRGKHLEIILYDVHPKVM